jgi:hypothetical protein
MRKITVELEEVPLSVNSEHDTTRQYLFSTTAIKLVNGQILKIDTVLTIGDKGLLVSLGETPEWTKAIFIPWSAILLMANETSIDSLTKTGEP